MVTSTGLCQENEGNCAENIDCDTGWQFNRIFLMSKSWPKSSPNSSPTRSRSSLGRCPSLGGLLGNLKIQGGNSIGFLDCLTDHLKMGDGLKMSDFGSGMI